MSAATASGRPLPERPEKPVVLEVNPDGIPAELKARDQWVRWRMTWDEARGAWTKVPIHPSADRKASTTDPATWASFEEVLAHVGAHNTNGVGFVFSVDDPYAGVDLDHCRDRETGEINPAAQTIVAALSSYTEISPSGTGLHIIVKAATPGGAGRKKKWIEVYSTGRYFVMTGQVIGRE